MAKILLVEDDQPTRDATRRMLYKLGFKAAEAANGRDALQWLDYNGPPALILLDLMMPEMDGFAFLDAIRERRALRAVPVVVLTAKDLNAEEKRMLTGRTAQVLAKGETSNHDLGEAIRRCIAPPPVDAEHQPVA